jgi:hypothetical protein
MYYMCSLRGSVNHTRKSFAMGALAFIAVVALFFWAARPRGPRNDNEVNQDQQNPASPNQPQTFTQEHRRGLFGREYHHFTMLPPNEDNRRGLRGGDLILIGIIVAVVLAFLLFN